MILAAANTVNSKVPWILSRASGLTALVILMIVILLGAMNATGFWAAIGRPKWKRTSLAWHMPLAWTAGAAVLLHVVLLSFDSWLHPGIKGLIAPITLKDLPHAAWAQIGPVALLCLCITIASFYARRRLRGFPGGWRRIHLLGWFTAVLIFAHALGAGTDLQAGWGRQAVWGGVVVFLTLLFVRLIERKSPKASKA